MAISRSAGYPDYTFGGVGTPGNANIPVIFSTKMLVKFYKATVFGEIANTEYEGEIKNQGDTVEIRTIPDITIRDYTKGQKLTLERPESTAVELLIDKAKYFNAGLDDIDVKQFDINMLDKWAEDASEQMKITIDSAILQYLDSAEHASNSGASAGAISGNIALGVDGTTVSISKSNVIDYIVSCGQVLDEQNIPETDRWMVIPAWMSALIKTSDLKDASLTGDSVTPMRNGKLGMIDRFTLYKSNQLYNNGTATQACIPFGHKSALTFASQIVKTEIYRPQDTFADAIKGLQVYGYKVIKPEALGIMWGSKA